MNISDCNEDDDEEDSYIMKLQEIWSEINRIIGEIGQTLESGPRNRDDTQPYSKYVQQGKDLHEKKKKLTVIQNTCTLHELLGRLMVESYALVVDTDKCKHQMRALYNIIFVYDSSLSTYHIQRCDAPWNAKQLIYQAILYLRCMCPESYSRDVSSATFVKVLKQGFICVDKAVCDYSIIDAGDSVKLLELRWRTAEFCCEFWEYIDVLETRIALLVNLVHSYEIDEDLDCTMNPHKMRIMDSDSKMSACSDDVVSEWCETILDILKTKTANAELRKLNLRRLESVAHFSVGKFVPGFVNWISHGEQNSEASEKGVLNYMLKSSSRPGELAHYYKCKLGIRSIDYENIFTFTRLNFSSQGIIERARSDLAAGVINYEAGILALAQFDQVCALNITDKPGRWLRRYVWDSQDVLLIQHNTSYNSIPVILLLAGKCAVLFKCDLVICNDAVEAIIVWALIVSRLADAAQTFQQVSQPERSEIGTTREPEVSADLEDDEEREEISDAVQSAKSTLMLQRSLYLKRVITRWEKGLEDDEMSNLSWGQLK